ncbi:MAG: MATE family efflux transporter [Phycisphaerae bacterium]|nr:MATE family efflux transporter [Phycisphaerae bacterium]
MAIKETPKSRRGATGFSPCGAAQSSGAHSPGARAEVLGSSATHEVLPSMGEEARRLLTLAAPMIGTMVSRMAMGFVDFILVSMLGTEATAAISPSTICVFSVLCLGMGAVMSIQTFSAQALGRRRHRDAAAYAWHGFYVAAVFGAISLPVILLVKPFWALVGHAPGVQALENAYCETAFWCMGFTVLCASLEGFFNGVQKPSVALVAALVALVVNALGSYCLIFGKLGFPALGIRGAAIATVAAWGIRAAMLVTVFLSREFHLGFRTRHTWRFDADKLKGIFRIGGPIAIQWVLDIGAWFVFLTLLVSQFGTTSMAAANIGLQYMHASFMPAIGLGIGVCSLVGHAIGERRPNLAAQRARLGMVITGLYMGAIGLLFLFARRPLMGLLSNDPEVIHLGAGVLIWAAIFQVFDAAQITYVNALRGAGDTRWPALVVAGHCWIVFILGGYLVARIFPHWGLHGPWMMCTLYIILLGLALWRRFDRGAWRKIDLFKDQPAPSNLPVVSSGGSPPSAGAPEDAGQAGLMTDG